MMPCAFLRVAAIVAAMVFRTCCQGDEAGIPRASSNEPETPKREPSKEIATFEGRLGSNDPVHPLFGIPFRTHPVKRASTPLHIFELQAGDVGFMMQLEDSRGRLLAEADQGDDETPPVLAVRIEQEGAYRLVVGLRGNPPSGYRVTSRPASATEIADFRRREEWTALNAKGTAALRRGDMKAASTVFEDLLRRAPDHFPTDRYPRGHSLIAANFENLADVRIAQGNLPEAEALWKKTLAMRRNLFPARRFPNGHPLLADTINNLGFILESQGFYASSETLFAEALAMRQKLFPKAHFPFGHPDLANSLNNLAAAYATRGDYAHAEVMYRDALRIRRALYSKDAFPRGHPVLAGTLNNLANTLHDQGNHAEAEAMFAEALGIYRSLYPKSEYPLGHPHLANILNNLAVVRTAQRQFAKAEELHRQARTMSQGLYPKEKYPRGHPFLARSTNNLGFVLQAQGDFQSAETLLREALKMREDLYPRAEYPLGHLDIANSLDNLGLVRQAQGDLAGAEEKFRQTLQAVRELVSDDHPLMATASTHLADALRLQGRIEGAEAASEKAAQAFRASRLRVRNSGLDRAGFAADYSPLELLAVLRAKRGKNADAWEAFEEDRGHGLLDDMLSKTNRPLEASERSREEHLLRGLATLEKNLAEAANAPPEQTAAWRKERDALLAECLRFRNALEAKYGPVVGQVFGLARIRASLAEDSAVVGWIDIPGNPSTGTGEEHWGVVLRSRGDPSWVKLPPADSASGWTAKDDRIADECREALRNPDIDWQEHRRVLVRQRLAPLEPHLQDVRSLIVLPSRRMAGIPLEALTDRHVVSYAPSATIYAWLREKREAPAASGLLIVGDAEFSPAPEPRKEGPLSRGREFRRLPGSALEAAALAAIAAKHGAAVRSLLRKDATVANLEKLAEEGMDRFRHVHLATHGKAVPQSGLNSFLAFTSEDATRMDYGKLSAGQILKTWKLNADLATLSACETAIGQHQGGEGYLGFSQALLFAGARTLVLSQGEANDHAATLTMIRFYENLHRSDKLARTRMTKAEALSDARRWLRDLTRDEAYAALEGAPREWRDRLPPGRRPFAHPHYWASFVLIGDPGR